MEDKPLRGSDGHEAERLLAAYLNHVEREAHAHKPDEKIVLVLPDTEVAERKRKATPTASTTPRKKKRARAGR